MSGISACQNRTCRSLYLSKSGQNVFNNRREENFEATKFPPRPTAPGIHIFFEPSLEILLLGPHVFFLHLDTHFVHSSEILKEVLRSGIRDTLKEIIGRSLFFVQARLNLLCQFDMKI